MPTNYDSLDAFKDVLRRIAQEEMIDGLTSTRTDRVEELTRAARTGEAGVFRDAENTRIVLNDVRVDGIEPAEVLAQVRAAILDVLNEPGSIPGENEDLQAAMEAATYYKIPTHVPPTEPTIGRPLSGLRAAHHGGRARGLRGGQRAIVDEEDLRESTQTTPSATGSMNSLRDDFFDDKRPSDDRLHQSSSRRGQPLFGDEDVDERLLGRDPRSDGTVVGGDKATTRRPQPPPRQSTVVTRPTAVNRERGEDVGNPLLDTALTGDKDDDEDLDRRSSVSSNPSVVVQGGEVGSDTVPPVLTSEHGDAFHHSQLEAQARRRDQQVRQQTDELRRQTARGVTFADPTAPSRRDDLLDGSQVNPPRRNWAQRLWERVRGRNPAPTPPTATYRSTPYDHDRFPRTFRMSDDEPPARDRRDTITAPSGGRYVRVRGDDDDSVAEEEQQQSGFWRGLLNRITGRRDDTGSSTPTSVRSPLQEGDGDRDIHDFVDRSSFDSDKDLEEEALDDLMPLPDEPVKEKSRYFGLDRLFGVNSEGKRNTTRPIPRASAAASRPEPSTAAAGSTQSFEEQLRLANSVTKLLALHQAETVKRINKLSKQPPEDVSDENNNLKEIDRRIMVALATNGYKKKDRLGLEQWFSKLDQGHYEPTQQGFKELVKLEAIGGFLDKGDKKLRDFARGRFFEMQQQRILLPGAQMLDHVRGGVACSIESIQRALQPDVNSTAPSPGATALNFILERLGKSDQVKKGMDGLKAEFNKARSRQVDVNGDPDRAAQINELAERLLEGIDPEKINITDWGDLSGVVTGDENLGDLPSNIFKSDYHYHRILAQFNDVNINAIDPTIAQDFKNKLTAPVIQKRIVSRLKNERINEQNDLIQIVQAGNLGDIKGHSVTVTVPATQLMATSYTGTDPINPEIKREAAVQWLHGAGFGAAKNLETFASNEERKQYAEALTRFLKNESLSEAQVDLILKDTGVDKDEFNAAYDQYKALDKDHPIKHAIRQGFATELLKVKVRVGEPIIVAQLPLIGDPDTSDGAAPGDRKPFEVARITGLGLERADAQSLFDATNPVEAQNSDLMLLHLRHQLSDEVALPKEEDKQQALRIALAKIAAPDPGTGLPTESGGDALTKEELQALGFQFSPGDEAQNEFQRVQIITRLNHIPPEKWAEMPDLIRGKISALEFDSHALTTGLAYDIMLAPNNGDVNYAMYEVNGESILGRQRDDREITRGSVQTSYGTVKVTEQLKEKAAIQLAKFDIREKFGGRADRSRLDKLIKLANVEPTNVNMSAFLNDHLSPRNERSAFLVLGGTPAQKFQHLSILAKPAVAKAMVEEAAHYSAILAIQSSTEHEKIGQIYKALNEGRLDDAKTAIANLEVFLANPQAAVNLDFRNHPEFVAQTKDVAASQQVLARMRASSVEELKGSAKQKLALETLLTTDFEHDDNPQFGFGPAGMPKVLQDFFGVDEMPPLSQEQYDELNRQAATLVLDSRIQTAPNRKLEIARSRDAGATIDALFATGGNATSEEQAETALKDAVTGALGGDGASLAEATAQRYALELVEAEIDKLIAAGDFSGQAGAKLATLSMNGEYGEIITQIGEEDGLDHQVLVNAQAALDAKGEGGADRYATEVASRIREKALQVALEKVTACKNPEQLRFELASSAPLAAAASTSGSYTMPTSARRSTSRRWASVPAREPLLFPEGLRVCLGGPGSPENNKLREALIRQQLEVEVYPNVIRIYGQAAGTTASSRLEQEYIEADGHKFIPFKDPTSGVAGAFANTTKLEGEHARPVPQTVDIAGEEKSYNWKSSEQAYHAQKIIKYINDNQRTLAREEKTALLGILNQIKDHPGENGEFRPQHYNKILKANVGDGKALPNLSAEALNDNVVRDDAVAYDLMKEVIRLKLQAHPDLKDLAMECAANRVFPVEIAQSGRWGAGTDGNEKNLLGCAILECGNDALRKAERSSEIKISDPRAHYQGLMGNAAVSSALAHDSAVNAIGKPQRPVSISVVATKEQQAIDKFLNDFAESSDLDDALGYGFGTGGLFPDDEYDEDVEEEEEEEEEEEFGADKTAATSGGVGGGRSKTKEKTAVELLGLEGNDDLLFELRNNPELQNEFIQKVVHASLLQKVNALSFESSPGEINETKLDALLNLDTSNKVAVQQYLAENTTLNPNAIAMLKDVRDVAAALEARKEQLLNQYPLYDSFADQALANRVTELQNKGATPEQLEAINRIISNPALSEHDLRNELGVLFGHEVENDPRSDSITNRIIHKQLALNNARLQSVDGKVDRQIYRRNLSELERSPQRALERFMVERSMAYESGNKAMEANKLSIAICGDTSRASDIHQHLTDGQSVSSLINDENELKGLLGKIGIDDPQQEQVIRDITYEHAHATIDLNRDGDAVNRARENIRDFLAEDFKPDSEEGLLAKIKPLKLGAKKIEDLQTILDPRSIDAMAEELWKTSAGRTQVEELKTFSEDLQTRIIMDLDTLRRLDRDLVALRGSTEEEDKELCAAITIKRGELAASIDSLRQLKQVVDTGLDNLIPVLGGDYALTHNMSFRYDDSPKTDIEFKRFLGASDNDTTSVFSGGQGEYKISRLEAGEHKTLTRAIEVDDGSKVNLGIQRTGSVTKAYIGGSAPQPTPGSPTPKQPSQSERYDKLSRLEQKEFAMNMVRTMLENYDPKKLGGTLTLSGDPSGQLYWDMYDALKATGFPDKKIHCATKKNKYRPNPDIEKDFKGLAKMVKEGMSQRIKKNVKGKQSGLNEARELQESMRTEVKAAHTKLSERSQEQPKPRGMSPRR